MECINILFQKPNIRPNFLIVSPAIPNETSSRDAWGNAKRSKLIVTSRSAKLLIFVDTNCSVAVLAKKVCENAIFPEAH